MVKKDNQDLPATTESQDVFERFDEIDDKVILRELENQVIDDWVYHFVVEGHHIWGLGKVGIDACTRKMGEKGIALRDDSVDYDVDPTNPEYVLFTAKVSRHVVNEQGLEAAVESAIGTKRQWTILILRRKIQGEYKLFPNKFWFEQGSQKALRNAKARLIPDEIKTKIIEFAKTHKKVKEIDAPVAQKRPDTTPESEKKPDSSKSPPEPEKKSESSTHPSVKEEAVFPDDKERGLGFPPETKEETQAEMPTHKERMELTGLEATLVDAYGFTPDQVIEKLNEKFGESELTKLSKVQTKEGIDYFKKTIEYLNKNK